MLDFYYNGKLKKEHVYFSYPYDLHWFTGFLIYFGPHYLKDNFFTLSHKECEVIILFISFRYDKVEEMLREFYDVRLKYYARRKDFLEGQLQAEADKLTNQARFIVEKCDKGLVIENKKRKAMVEELIKRGIYFSNEIHLVFSFCQSFS